MHAGLSASQGHYTSHAWLGDSCLRTYSSHYQYICFNDERWTTHAFSDLATPRAREEVYALMYVREKYHSDDVGDGSESTPWGRDKASRDLCSKYFRGELRSSSSHSASSVERMADASASSASPATGAVHGPGGLRASASVARPQDARQGGGVPDGDALGDSLDPRSSAASGVASSSCGAPANTSGASLGGLAIGGASESGNVQADEDDAKGAPSRSGGESSGKAICRVSFPSLAPRRHPRFDRKTQSGGSFSMYHDWTHSQAPQPSQRAGTCFSRFRSANR